MASAACACLFLLLAVTQVYGHGSLTFPRSRNVLRPINGETWWKDHGNGHGGTYTAAGPKPSNGPGVCGDPFQHFGDSSFYQRMAWGPSQATYSVGGVINVQWHLQVNHGGRIGVKLCPRTTNLNQACFDQYPLFRTNPTSERYVYIMSGVFSFNPPVTMSMNADFRLPAGVSCANGCVLQWEYLTMNSCFEPCNRAVCGSYADRVNPVNVNGGNLRNMGDCCLGSGCNPNFIPEVFRNCADITITGSAAPPPNTPTPPPPTTGTCARTAASGGACGSGTCCPNGECCSRFGWCGTSTSHCGSGCQCPWGRCSSCSGPPPGTPAPPPTSCTSTVAAGSQCGSGRCCPSGQCCSSAGWCGITSAHCGNGCQRSFSPGTCWSTARAVRAARRANATAAAASTVATATATAAAPEGTASVPVAGVTVTESVPATETPVATETVAPMATETVTPAAINTTALVDTDAGTVNVAAAAAAGPMDPIAAPEP